MRNRNAAGLTINLGEKTNKIQLLIDSTKGIGKELDLECSFQLQVKSIRHIHLELELSIESIMFTRARRSRP